MGAKSITARRRLGGSFATSLTGRGFTLIEMMIVLAIIGVAVAMIRLSGGVLDRVAGGASAGDESDVSLRRFVHSVAGASERALVRGRPIALELATGRYRFYTLDAAGRWLPIDDSPVFAERSIPDDWRWDAVERDGNALEAPHRLLFGNEPVRFSIRIAAADRRYVVRGNSVGAVDWVAQ
ncbi:MAG TPA: prepilin-type N-terminal cleavage/methylation domain-containing protein [Rhodocyclaceae bacterium]|nr:prepilin-type N-terminal cleavage/methylation domain-containing protein [Rhodocyclaceae bacterium]